MNQKIKVKVLKTSKELPKYQTKGSAGLDVVVDKVIATYSANNYACKDKYIEKVNERGSFYIASKERVIVGTGLKVAVPEGYELQVRPRSGLSAKKGITVVNSPGTIDSDYRGEIGIILINVSDKMTEIKFGERVAQLVLKKVEQLEWEISDNLPDTKRGEGGYGSTN